MDSLLTAQIFAVLSALAFSTGSLTSRYGLRTSTPLASTLILGLVTLAIYGPIALRHVSLIGVRGERPADISRPRAPHRRGWPGLCFNMSIQRVGLARSVTIINVAPLVTVVLAVAALGERPSPGVYLGTFLLVVGVMLLTQEQRAASKSDSSGKTPLVLLSLCAACGSGARGRHRHSKNWNRHHSQSQHGALHGGARDPPRSLSLAALPDAGRAVQIQPAGGRVVSGERGLYKLGSSFLLRRPAKGSGHHCGARCRPRCPCSPWATPGCCCGKWRRLSFRLAWPGRFSSAPARP